MRRYVIYTIILFMIFISIISAENTLELNNKIIEFPSIENYSLQGFTVTKDSLFIVLNGYDDKLSKILIYDLQTHNKIKEYDFSSLGHANDVTYNINNNKIYVLAGGGSNDIFIFNGDTYLYEDKITIDLPARSITYIEDMDIYAIRTVSTGFKLDNEFKLKNKLPFIVGMNIRNDIGRQGWDYYNGYIYYSNWSWIRLGGDGSNVIFVYDLKGNLVDTFYTEKDIGEIEDVAFYNKKMILGFNNYDDKITFYEINVPEIEIKEEQEVKEEIQTSEVKTVKENSLTHKVIIFISFILIICIIVLQKKKNK